MLREHETLEKERKFHDNWALNIDIEHIDVNKFFTGSTSPENRYILGYMGDLKEKCILDVGCGAGENSVFFALNGAQCIAIDYSALMVDTAKALAKRYGVTIEALTMNVMELEFPDNSFDYVYAANLLHHVDSKQTLREMHRVLKPGGKACFWDPLKHNPLIKIYRRMAKAVRTSNEHPLDIRIINFAHSLFSKVEYDTFWLATLWIFLQFYLIERVDPNQERYWKKIIFEEERLRKNYYRLEKLDGFMKRLSFIKRFAWNIAVVATK